MKIDLKAERCTGPGKGTGIFSWLCVAVCLTLVAGCATLDGSDAAEAETASESSATSQAKPSPGLATSAAGLATASAEPLLFRGNDQQVRLPKPRVPVRFVGEDVSLNFENAPLGEVVHAILNDILGIDYIVDRPIQGTVTLRTRTPIPRPELLGVLESLLRANDTLMIAGEDGRYLVTGAQDANRLSPRVASAYDTAAGYSTVVVPLQYISATAMAEILKPVADENALVRVDSNRNLLMLAGTREQIDGWMDMVHTFDVDMLKGMSMGMFPLENSTVEEVMETLIGLLGGEGEGGLAGAVRLVPVQRLNSILVVTPRAKYLDGVKVWIERLDAAPDSNFEKRLYVYEVQNTTAARLAGLLSSIYSGGAMSGGAGSQGASSGAFGADRRGGQAPGMTPETLGGGSSALQGSNRRGGGSTGGFGGATGGAAGGMGGFGGGGGAASGAGGLSGGAGGFSNNTQATGAVSSDIVGDSPVSDVRVVADDENNALMIYASGKQYKLIETALKQLDVVATQVIIEASIMEVSLTEDLQYGLEWSFSNTLNGLSDGYRGLGVLGNPAAATAPAGGFSYSISNGTGDIKAVLTALAEDSLLNVISTPSVMVLDNHTAYIHVGDQIPVLQGSSQNVGGNVVENIQYRDTGVQLSVRPSVNAGGLVTLDVEQSVTDVGAEFGTTGQPIFLERSIMSRVAVRSNESVVLGGLIRENSSTSSTGLPFLHSIPVIGALFGRDNIGNRRTELLVVITPRAIYNESELREVSKEMRSRIRFMELIDVPETP